MAYRDQRRGVLLPTTIDGVELLIETVPVAGSEQTSGRLDDATDRIGAAFDRSHAAIVAIASKVAETATELATLQERPTQVQVEFGLAFSATGNLIVAGSTAEASLKVAITFDARGRAEDQAESAGTATMHVAPSTSTELQPTSQPRTPGV